MSAAVSALPVNTEEHRAIAIMAELYSGFVNEKKVAKDLAALSTPVERLEEILKYRLHPALYTQLVWNGTGFESQQALTSQQVEEKLVASTDYDRMNIVGVRSAACGARSLTDASHSGACRSPASRATRSGTTVSRAPGPRFARR